MRQMNDDLAAILLGGRSRYMPQHLKPIDQFHSAVMFQLQPFRHFPDSRHDALRQALDGQKQLVLLRLYAGGPNLFFAEAQESPDLIAELGQRTVVFQ